MVHAIAHLAVEVCGVFEEGAPAGCELEHDHCHSKDVGRVAVVLGKILVRALVLRVSDLRGGLEDSHGGDLRAAETGQLERHVRHEKEVAGAALAVDELETVQLLESEQHMAGEVHDYGLAEGLTFLVNEPADVLEGNRLLHFADGRDEATLGDEGIVVTASQNLH